MYWKIYIQKGYKYIFVYNKKIYDYEEALKLKEDLNKNCTLPKGYTFIIQSFYE